MTKLCVPTMVQAVHPVLSVYGASWISPPSFALASPSPPCPLAAAGTGSNGKDGGKRKGASAWSTSSSSGRTSIGDVDTLEGQRAVLEALVQETEKVTKNATTGLSRKFTPSR